MWKFSSEVSLHSEPMAGFYLDFEKPIVDLDQKIDEMIEMSADNNTAWEDLGADLVSIGTARAPFTTPDEHIQAIKTFKDIV